MIVKTKGYNIPFITDMGTFTSGTPKETGTVKQFREIHNMVSNSGICYGEFILGTAPMKGYAICNPYAPDAIEIIITTNFGNQLQIITGLYYISGNKAMMVLTQNTLE